MSFHESVIALVLISCCRVRLSTNQKVVGSNLIVVTLQQLIYYYYLTD
jgi:hypothetical protein